MVHIITYLFYFLLLPQNEDLQIQSGDQKIINFVSSEKSQRRLVICHRDPETLPNDTIHHMIIWSIPDEFRSCAKSNRYLILSNGIQLPIIYQKPVTDCMEYLPDPKEFYITLNQEGTITELSSN